MKIKKNFYIIFGAVLILVVVLTLVFQINSQNLAKNTNNTPSSKNSSSFSIVQFSEEAESEEASKIESVKPIQSLDNTSKLITSKLKDYPNFAVSYNNSWQITENEVNNTKILSLKKNKSSIQFSLTPAFATGYAGGFPCGFIVKDLGNYVRYKFADISQSDVPIIREEYIIKSALIPTSNNPNFNFEENYNLVYGDQEFELKKDDMKFCGNGILSLKTKTSLPTPDISEFNLNNHAFVNIESKINESEVEEMDKIILSIQGIEKIS
jgi:hypothetical protein